MNRAAWRWMGGLTLALAMLIGGCARRDGPGPFPGAPVVLISIDTLRADRLPAWGYDRVATPGIDRLVARSIRFAEAFSHYPLTLPSHTAMLSGQLPPAHGVRDNVGYRFDVASHPFLPRSLAGAGYATGGFVSSFVLRSDTGLGAGFDRYDSEIALEAEMMMSMAQREGLATAARAAAWVRAQGQKPFFLFLHLYEPHAPYDPPEPFRSRYSERPYDGEVATADAVVGGFLDELGRLGILDRAIVAVVGDHGEGLGDHGESQHGVFLYRATLHVPMILKLPKGERGGTTVAAPVGLVDLAPTILDLLGIEQPAGLDGESLFSAGRSPRSQRLYAETYYPRLHLGWSELRALIDPSWYFVDSAEPELFAFGDLAQATDLATSERRAIGLLRDESRGREVPLAPPTAVDAETAAQLAALGYLAGSSNVRTSGPLPTPKSQRHLLADLEAGMEAIGAKDSAKAIVHFERLVAANSEMLDVWTFLARAYDKEKRFDDAIRAWERAMQLSGGDPSLALAFAATLVDAGRFDEARRHAMLAEKANPEGVEDILVQIELATGHADEARRRMEAAVVADRASETMRGRVAFERLSDGRPAEAYALLEGELATAKAATLTIAGLALSELGRNLEGLTLLDRAVAGDPKDAKAKESRGIVLLRLERAADAKVELERALAIDPKLPDAWTTLGVARYQLEGPGPAMEAWKRAVAIDAEQFDALFNLGLVAAAAGDRAEARRALRSYLATAPADRYAAERARAAGVLRELGG